MKNKWFTRALIIVVVLVWGIIFYRIFKGLSDEPKVEVTSAGPKSVYFKLTDHASDQVTIDLDYRDPFTKANNASLTPSGPTAILTPKIAAPVAPYIWPDISFKGFIYNATLKKKVALLNLNGNAFTLAEGQTLNGLKLIKLAGDSIKVQYQNRTKFISIR